MFTHGRRGVSLGFKEDSSRMGHTTSQNLLFRPSLLETYRCGTNRNHLRVHPGRIEHPGHRGTGSWALLRPASTSTMQNHLSWQDPALPSHSSTMSSCLIARLAIVFCSFPAK